MNPVPPKCWHLSTKVHRITLDEIKEYTTTEAVIFSEHQKFLPTPHNAWSIQYKNTISSFSYPTMWITENTTGDESVINTISVCFSKIMSVIQLQALKTFENCNMLFSLCLLIHKNQYDVCFFGCGLLAFLLVCLFTLII